MALEYWPWKPLLLRTSKHGNSKIEGVCGNRLSSMESLIKFLCKHLQVVFIFHVFVWVCVSFKWWESLHSTYSVAKIHLRKGSCVPSSHQQPCKEQWCCYFLSSLVKGLRTCSLESSGLFSEWQYVLQCAVRTLAKQLANLQCLRG